MKHVTLIRKMQATAVASLVLAVCAAQAQTQAATNAPSATPATPAPAALPAVVVTATRTEENPFSLPYSVSAVSSLDLERKMPRTTPEALRELPSVMLQKTSHGQGSPYLRVGEDVGLQPETGYGEWDFDAKVEYFLSPNSRLVYGHQTVRLDDAWRTHATIYGVLWSGTTRGTDLQREFDQARDCPCPTPGTTSSVTRA